MSLPASLAYRDLLWIVIPGTLIIILFAPAIDLRLHSSDLAVIILGGVIIGYVLVWPLGYILDRMSRVYDKSKQYFSSRHRHASKELSDEEKKWDFAKVHIELKTDEKQHFSDLDGYKHLHGFLSIIFLFYSAYNLSILLRFGMASNNTILGFEVGAVFLAPFSAVSALFTWKSFLRYSQTMRTTYIRYAEKYHDSTRQTDSIPPSP